MKTIILIIMYIALVGYGFYAQNQNEGLMNAFGEIPTLLFDLILAYFIVFKFFGGMWSEHEEEKEKNDIIPPQSKPIIHEISKNDFNNDLNEYPEIESKEIAEKPFPKYEHNPDLVVELVEKRTTLIEGGSVFRNLAFYTRHRYCLDSYRRLYHKEKKLIITAKIEKNNSGLECHFYTVENSEDRYYSILSDNEPPLKEGDILDIDSIEIMKFTRELTGEIFKRIAGKPIGYIEKKS